MNDLALPPTTAVLYEVVLPLVRPFTASHGDLPERRAVLVRLIDEHEVEGWGECGADVTSYSAPETPATAWADLTERLIPSLLHNDVVQGSAGPMARAGLADALDDLHAKQVGSPLAVYLGGRLRPVPVGAVAGITTDRQALVDEVAEYVDAGYQRIKLKIRPGWDVEPVGWIRRQWPRLALAVDANGSYRPHHTSHLKALDEYGLVFLEQPFAAPDLDDHARLALQLETPLCLDESITSSVEAKMTIEKGAASLIAIKSSRLGGLQAAKDVYRLCIEGGIRPWVGGMLETGIGRARAVALATLDGFSDPADLSGSARYYHDDLVTPPWLANSGTLTPNDAPGIGCSIDHEVLRRHTVRHEVFGEQGN